jgi:hypothetical protein
MCDSEIQNILDNYVNQKYMPSIPCPLRDVSRSSRHVGRGRRWTRRSQAQRLDFERNQGSDAGRKAAAYGEVVWSWRRDPGATLAGSIPLTTGARKAASPGRVRISRKTIARGKPGCLGCTCGLTRVLFCSTLRTRDCGRSRRPAFPAPSDQERADEMQNLGQIGLRERERVSCFSSFRGAANGSRARAPDDRLRGELWCAIAH